MTPDNLLLEKDSQSFYVLHDGNIRFCKNPTDLPFYKIRKSYKSAGVICPSKKEILYYGDSTNTSDCTKLVKESLKLEEDLKESIVKDSKIGIPASTKQNYSITKMSSRKGIAGFNRLKPNDKLQAQDIKRKPVLKQIESAGQTATPQPTPHPTIKINTKSNLTQQT